MIWRIRSRRTFAELKTRGQRARSGPVRMSFVTAETARPQVAFAIGRRFGNAVERNRARRRLRAAFATGWVASPGPLGAYLLSGTRSLLTVEFGELVSAVEACVGQLHADQVPTGASRR